MEDLRTQSLVINAILFQIAWFAAVAAQSIVCVGVLLLMLVHHWRCVPGLGLLLKLVALATLGIAMDTLMLNVGVFTFPGREASGLGSHVIPFWLVVIWLAFSLTLSMSLRWLLMKPVVFIALCGIAGPLSYYAGTRLDALYFELSHLPFIVAEWLLVGSAIFLLLGRDKVSRDGGLCAA